MFTSRMYTWLLLLWIARVIGSPVYGQATFGSIIGAVTDASGAVIPGAAVTIMNQRTSISREVLTNNVGEYVGTHLNPGIYVVTVAAPGFKTARQTDISVEALSTVRIDVRLEVGAAGTEVVVTGRAPVVQSEQSSIDHIRGTRQLLDLPLNIRSSNNQAGSSPLYNMVFLVPAGGGSGNMFSLGGSRSSQNYFNVDGISSNSAAFGNQIASAQPSIESVQEVRFEIANNKAEFSEVATITSITKSGTNDFHGGVFWYHFNSAMLARNFFSTEKGHNIRNDFGGTLGGPIKRNKAFFFLAYEGERQRRGNVLSPSVPTRKMRNGDFSELLTSAAAKKILNPYTGQAFPGNVIPTGLLNQAALRFQELLYPMPNFGPPELFVANYRGTFPEQISHDQADVRLDYQFSSNNTLYARVSPKHSTNNLIVSGVPPQQGGYQQRALDTIQLAVSDTWLINSNLINEVKFGYLSRDIARSNEALKGQELIDLLGIQGFPRQPANENDIPPRVQITGFQSINVDAYGDNIERTTQYIDQLTWVYGRHMAKAGVEYRPIAFNNGYLQQFGRYDFTSRYTGFAYADFLLGLPSTTSRTYQRPYRRARAWTASWFLQDDFRVHPRLTLSYGLRWDYDNPAVDEADISSNFDPSTGSIVVPSERSLGNVNPLFPKQIQVVTATQAGFPARGLRYPDKNNFLPRFGFAFRPFNDASTAIRGGYGVYVDSLGLQIAGQLIGTPFQVTESFVNKISNGTPLLTFDQPFLGVGSPGSIDATSLDRRLRNAYVQQWNFTFERELWASSTAMRVSYIGTKGNGLIYRRDLNKPPASALPFSQSRRPYPLFRSVTMAENGGTQIYNAMSLNLDRRMSRGLAFQASWTWAKNLTDVDDTASVEAGTLIEDTFDRRRERGDANYTPRHRIIGNMIWELPVGEGRRWLNRGGIWNGALGGWQLSATVIAQTGRFLTPSFSGSDPSNTQTIGGIPDRIGDGNLPKAQRSIDRWFDQPAFTVPPNGRFGNCGRGILTGPGHSVLDLGLYKQFAISDRGRLRIQVSATNVLNHPNFGTPSLNISAPGSVGTIRSLQSQDSAGPRELLVGARLDF